MSDFPTPQQRLGRAVRYFTPVVLASALAVPMISSAESTKQAEKSKTPNGKAVGQQPQAPAVEGAAPATTVAAQAVAEPVATTDATETAPRGNGNGNAWGTAHNGDQGNGKGNGNGNDMGNGKAHGDDKPGNGPKDRGDDKHGNGPEDEGDDEHGNGPKDKGDDKHGNGPKDQNGDGHPGHNGGNGHDGEGNDHGDGHGKPGEDGEDGKDGKDAPAAQQPLTVTPVVTTIASSKAPAACKSVRRFRIHLSPRKLRSARVTLNGKAVRVTRTPSGAWAMINLRGTSTGTQIVRTVVVTRAGKVRREVRRYRTCATTKTALRNLVRKATRH